MVEGYVYMYIGDHKVFIIDINNGIKDLPIHIQIVILVIYSFSFSFSWLSHVKARESLYSRVISWVHVILNHIDIITHVCRFLALRT